MTKKIETIPKAHQFKVNDRIRITKYKNIFSKGCIENWSREMFIIDSVNLHKSRQHKQTKCRQKIRDVDIKISDTSS